jgi:acrylyl-CoA reductase (NADPH)
MDLPTTVMPFILRNVRLIGVDSVMAPLSLRQQAWDRLASDLDLAKLEHMVEEVSLEQAIDKAHALMAGQVRGRIVVKI